MEYLQGELYTKDGYPYNYTGLRVAKAIGVAGHQGPDFSHRRRLACASHCTIRPGLEIPAAKNAPPERFLNAASSPFQQIKMKTLQRCWSPGTPPLILPPLAHTAAAWSAALREAGKRHTVAFSFPPFEPLQLNVKQEFSALPVVRGPISAIGDVLLALRTAQYGLGSKSGR